MEEITDHIYSVKFLNQIYYNLNKCRKSLKGEIKQVLYFESCLSIKNKINIVLQ